MKATIDCFLRYKFENLNKREEIFFVVSSLLKNENSQILQTPKRRAIAPAKSPIHFDFVEPKSIKYTKYDK